MPPAHPAPAVISTAHAGDLPKIATAVEIAQQNANGGEFGGVTPGTTGLCSRFRASP
jgi:hypothetical protein